MVKVFGKAISQSDFSQKLPSGVSSKDSLEFSNKLLNEMIAKEVIYHHAKEEINSNDSLEKIIESYKKMIYTQALKEKITQKVDTSISKEQMKEFISSLHLSQMPHSGYIKAQLMIFHSKTPNLDKFKKYLNNHQEKEIENYCLKYAENSQLDLNKWHPVFAFLEKTPFQNDKKINKTGIFHSAEDDLEYYLYIKNIVQPSEELPYEVLYAQFSSLLLAQRKEKIWEQYVQDKFNLAIKNKEIQYN